MIDAPFAVPKAKRRNRAAFARQEETCTPFLPLFRRYYRRISKIRPFRRFSHSLLHFGQQAADEISDRHKSRLSMTHPRENGRNPLFGRWKQSEYSSWNETLAIPSQRQSCGRNLISKTFCKLLHRYCEVLIARRSEM